MEEIQTQFSSLRFGSSPPAQPSGQFLSMSPPPRYNTSVIASIPLSSEINEFTLSPPHAFGFTPPTTHHDSYNASALKPSGIEVAQQVQDSQTARDGQAIQAPTSKRFSFSVSAVWKNENNMMRWLTEVPTVRRIEPLPPAQYHGEKHALVST